MKVFPKLKDYAQYLLDHQLDELVKENIKLAWELDLPLMKLFKHLTEEELFELSKDGIRKFLLSFKEGRAMEVADASIMEWKENKIKGISKEEVTPTDLILIYSIRKQILINHLSFYTSDFHLAIGIIKELEEYYSSLERYAMETLLQIQKEDWEHLNQEMKIVQEKLRNSNLHLQQNQEELQSLNEELAATNEELSSTNEELAAANEELQAANEEQTKHIIQIEKIKKELEYSRDYYLTLLHDFPALIWRANTEGQCDYFNKTWLDFTGRKLEQEYGHGWTEAVHPEDLDNCFEVFISNLKEKRPFVMEYRLRRFDGQYRWVVDYGKPIFGLKGQFSGFLGACFDITDQKEISEALKISNYQLKETNEELKRTEELLKESYNELEEKVKNRTKDLQKAKEEIEELLLREKAAYDEVNAQKLQLNEINLELMEKNNELLKINIDLDNFVYTASHDLKAPITNLEGLMNLLKQQFENKLEVEDKEILNMMATSIQKFKKTILDLTEITKVQKGFDDKSEPLSFKEVLEEVKTDLGPIIKESKATISEDLKVQQVLFSPNNLRSIFYNLISNAIKYRSLNKPLIINIKSYYENDFVVLSISDNGLGISESNKPKLFSMFKRFHTHVEGTGIGLYVIKRILENNKGKIEFESKEGEGTTFKVYFQAKDQKVLSNVNK